MAKPKRNPTSKSNKKSPKRAAVSSPPDTLSVPAVENTPKPEKTRRRFLRRPRQATPTKKLPNVLRLTKKSVTLLWDNRRLFLGIVAVHALLNILLAQAFKGIINLTPVKDVIGAGSLEDGVKLFTVLLEAVNEASAGAVGVIQTSLFIITSLAVVWTLRQIMAGEKVRIRDGFYKGMYPLVPVLLIVGVIFLEFIPFAIGGFIYGTVVSNGIATNFIELIPWALLYFASLLITLYLLTTSVIALYIATLPDMTPLKALRSAKQLVQYRRWAVLRKLVFLPFALLIVTFVIMVPMLLWLTPFAPWAFFLMSMLGIVVVHAYIYTLYRELLA